MTDLAQHLVNRLLVEGEKTADFFRSLPAEDLVQVIYTDGMAWNIKQVLLHLVATEESVFLLLQNINKGGKGVSPDFDIDEFNEKQIRAREFTSIDDVVHEFRVKRKQVADYVAELSEADLQKIGRHPYLGEAPLEEIIRLLYRHPQIHVRDIRRFLNKVS